MMTNETKNGNPEPKPASARIRVQQLEGAEFEGEGNGVTDVWVDIPQTFDSVLKADAWITNEAEPGNTFRVVRAWPIVKVNTVEQRVIEKVGA